MNIIVSSSKESLAEEFAYMLKDMSDTGEKIHEALQKLFLITSLRSSVRKSFGITSIFTGVMSAVFLLLTLKAISK